MKSYAKDIVLIREFLNLSLEDFCYIFEIDKSTLSRYEAGYVIPEDSFMDKVYSYAYKRGFHLNNVKALYYEQTKKHNDILLFHGAKNGLDGAITVNKSEEYKDFGKGFYLGDNYLQSGMFIANYRNSSLCYFYFDNEPEINVEVFDLSIEWVLAICYNRGFLEEYINHPLLKNALDRVRYADVIIAPIADNQMFDIMEKFAAGFITDEVCLHSLAAMNLGKQYVFKNDETISKYLSLKEVTTLCNEERNDLKKQREQFNLDNSIKNKQIEREFRGKGKYIDQLLCLD